MRIETGNPQTKIKADPPTNQSQKVAPPPEDLKVPTKLQIAFVDLHVWHYTHNTDQSEV